MNSLGMENPEDLTKLSGCHIHSAKVIRNNLSSHLELIIDHIELPVKVKIELSPAVSFQIFPGFMTAASSLAIHAVDVEEEVKPDG